MKRITLLLAFISFLLTINAQVFEAPKLNDEFEKVKVSVGGDFTLQFQALSHEADAVTLIPLGNNFNLPTANFTLSAMLAKGVKVNLTTYLSSRHHNEAWVKGGYLIMDRLPFASEGFLNDLMDNVTIKVGVDEINYGDAHFRRSDNGNTIRNAFVGNYIMDAYTTAPAAEIYYRKDGILGMLGLTTASLKPSVAGKDGANFVEDNAADDLGVYLKGAYDKQVNDMLRLRGAVSVYYVGSHPRGTLYGGDRSGSRYYLVMNDESMATALDITSNAFSGRWGPGSHNKLTAIMFNAFAKVKFFELFGTFESATGTYSNDNEFAFSQFAIEGLFRFGKDESFFVGGRYNVVNGDKDTNTDGGKQSVNRFQAIGGWKITNNIVSKLEYVNQTYNHFTEYGDNAGFKGIMFEATISF